MIPAASRFPRPAPTYAAFRVSRSPLARVTPWLPSARDPVRVELVLGGHRIRRSHPSPARARPTSQGAMAWSRPACPQRRL